MFAWVDREKYDVSKIAYRCKINGCVIQKANCIKPQTNNVKTSHILFVTSLHRLYAYISITTLYKVIICIKDNRKLLKQKWNLYSASIFAKFCRNPSRNCILGTIATFIWFCIIFLFIIKSQVLRKQQTDLVRLRWIPIHIDIGRDVICNEVYWETCEKHGIKINLKSKKFSSDNTSM